MNNLFNIKHIDLPIQIGGSTINSSLICSIKDAYKEMSLIKGSTYYFNVHYLNSPLTKEGVPYNPAKLKIMDIKNVQDLLISVYEEKKTHDHFGMRNLIHHYKGGFQKTWNSEVLFKSAISRMVWNSDLIKDILDNDHEKCIGTLNFPENGGFEITLTTEGVNRHYVLNLTVAVYRAMK